MSALLAADSSSFHPCTSYYHISLPKISATMCFFNSNTSRAFLWTTYSQTTHFWHLKHLKIYPMLPHLSANHIFMVTNYPHIVCLKYVWFSLTSPLGFVVSSSWNILSQHSCLCHLTHSSRTHLKSSFLKLYLFPQSVTIWLTPPALCVSSLQYLKYFFFLVL